MRKYPKYKISQIEYLGSLPENWELWKFKRLTDILTCGYASTPQYVDENVGVAFLSAQNVKPGRIVLDKFSYITKELHRELTKNKQAKNGDVLIARVGGEGNIGDAAIVNVDFDFSVYVSLAHIRTRKNLSNKFLVYFFQTDYAKLLSKIETQVGGGVGNLNVKDMERYKIPTPSLSEQHAIVRFLDYKTGQIDSFIANRQKQIELLKEQLRKKTYTALTKGLSNKDFKSTALPWFPVIPKNWELYKFNAAIKLLHGFQFRDNHFREQGIKVAKITQLKADGTLDLSEASFVEEKFLTLLKDKIIKSGDILMALTGGTIGKIICVDDLEEEVLQNYRVGKFIPKDKRNLNKEYMFWVLSSEFTFAQILFLQRETGQPNIGISDFSKMFFPMPDTLEEQIEITKFIVDQKSETNTLISKYQKQIDLMQEYRTSLISQAVTGKIDVREWQPKKQQIA